MKNGTVLLLVLALGACGGGTAKPGGTAGVGGNASSGSAGSTGSGTGGSTGSGTGGKTTGSGTGGNASGTGGNASGTGGNASGGGGTTTGTGPMVGTGNPNPTYNCVRELHVATTGSDTGDGSMAKPFKTINKVTPMAMPGDCIQVHAGTYAEGSTIAWMVDGTADKPIVLRSADGHLKAVIDAKTNRGGETVVIRHDNIIIDGFEFINSPMDTEQQCIHFDGLNAMAKGTGSVIRNCKATMGYDTIKLNQNSVGITVEYNEFYGTFQHLPVSLTGASNMTFRGNFCHDWTLNGDGAIQIKGGSHDSLFEGNVFQDIHTDAGAITMGDGCDSTCDIDPQHYAAVRIRAVNNVFVRVGRGLDVQGCKDCAILDNTFVDSGSGNVMFKLTSAATNGTTQATINARIMNNLITNTGNGGNVMQINSPAEMGLMMDYNLRWNGGMAVEWGDGHPATADTHSVTMDPKLTSATDFSLGAGSAAKGAGTNLFADVPIDFKGNARPMTGAFDIGAYQSQ
jgi:hypothetical protein